MSNTYFRVTADGFSALSSWTGQTPEKAWMKSRSCAGKNGGAAPAASFIMHAATAQMRRAGRRFNSRSIMDIEGDGCIGGAGQSVAKKVY
jgi:hypothetical protein